MIIKIFKRNDNLFAKNVTKNLYQFRHLSDNRETNERVVSSFTSSPSDEVIKRVAKRPLNIMPDHLPQCRPYQRQKPWWKYRYFVNINPLEDNKPEWTQTPEYPPLVDNSWEGTAKQIRMEWYNAIKRLPTAQQKEYEICKHYSHLTYLLESVQKQYNSLPLQQFITKTHLISGRMPFIYDQMDVNSLLSQDLKKQIIDSIVYHLFHTKQRMPLYEIKSSSLPLMGFTDEDIWAKTAKEEDLIEDVVSIVRKNLQSNYEHLFGLQADINPYVCSSWWVKEFPIPFPKKKWFPNEIWNQQFTYRSTHCLHLRSEMPLPPAISLEDDICTKSEISEYKYRLLKSKHVMKRHTMCNLPGFWVDSSNGFDFPNLICHSRQGLRLRERENSSKFDDIQEVLDGMAITSSFAWLHSLASNLGFTVYHELTYPLVTQGLITDGQFWNFFVYQLNAHSFHSDVDNNSLRNVCWTSGDLKLFDDYQNGELIGLNEEVFKLLIKFMTRTPQMPENCNLRPYLSEPKIEEQDIKELNYALRRRYSNWVSTFVKKRQQVHLWEQIYKYHKEAPPIPHIRSRPKLNFKYPPFFTK